MKTKIKKLVKSALLGVAVLGLAVGVSAFKSIENAYKMSQMTDVFVHSSPTSTDQYEKLPSAADYESSNCQSPQEDQCAWKRTDKPGTVPNTFNKATADSLHSVGLIEPLGSNKGIYNIQ